LLDTPIDGLGNIYITTTREKADRKDGQVVVILDKQHEEVGSLNLASIHIVINISSGGNDGKALFFKGLTAPMDGKKHRLCGDKTRLKAGIYTTKLNVKGFPF
jgi:gluconolactonase